MIATILKCDKKFYKLSSNSMNFDCTKIHQSNYGARKPSYGLQESANSRFNTTALDVTTTCLLKEKFENDDENFCLKLFENFGKASLITRRAPKSE